MSDEEFVIRGGYKRYRALDFALSFPSNRDRCISNPILGGGGRIHNNDNPDAVAFTTAMTMY